MKSVSTQEKLKKISLLVESNELTEWELGFAESILQFVKDHKGSTLDLSDKQLEMIQKIYRKYF